MDSEIEKPEIPYKLIDFLKDSFNLDWVAKAKIEKIKAVKEIGKDESIHLFTKKNSLLIELAGERAILKIDDGRTSEFVVEDEDQRQQNH